MPRLVRRQPLLARIQAYLNPLDFLLWLSEELDSNDWDEFQKKYATPLGLGLNLVFLVARANSGKGGVSRGADVVFGDEVSRSGLLTWFCSSVVNLLSCLSVLNFVYTFYRKRRYRLFEVSVDAQPGSSSAQRVRVDSSPMSSSPLRFLSSVIASTTAESRSHPDPTRDVWELGVWDPIPLCLRLFCLFSPGHVLVYWLFLPAAVHDPRPSTTVLTTIVLGVLLSVQLTVLRSQFSQQSKDLGIIHKEVLHEYDVKFVKPIINCPVRDVGTQYDAHRHSEADNTVDTYTPTTFVKRAYRTNPNPKSSYARHPGTGGEVTPSNPGRYMTPIPQSPSLGRDVSVPPQRAAVRQPQFRPSASGDGGSLGVFSHSNSPLRKAASTNHLGRSSSGDGDGHARHLAYGVKGQDTPARPRSPTKREGSPLKRSSVPGGGLAGLVHGQRLANAATGTSHRRDSGYF